METLDITGHLWWSPRSPVNCTNKGPIMGSLDMLFDVGLNSIINDRLIAALIVLIGIEINWHRRLCIKNYSEGSKTNLGGLGTTCSPCQTMVRWYVSFAERLYNGQYHTQNQQALLWKVAQDYSEHWIWTPYIWSTAMDRCSPALFLCDTQNVKKIATNLRTLSHKIKKK